MGYTDLYKDHLLQRLPSWSLTALSLILQAVLLLLAGPLEPIESHSFLSLILVLSRDSTGLRELRIRSKRQRRMLGFRQRTPSAGEKKKGSDAPPLEPPWGNPLRRHHMQTIIICIWVLCIIAYIGAIEKAIAEHSQPTSDRPGSMGVGGSFGGRGTRRRQEAVQILSFARTILTAVHVCSELEPCLTTLYLA